MKRLVVLSLCLAIASPICGAGFIEQLTPEKRRAAGLDKLTAAERDELEKLIEAHQLGELAEVREGADRKIAAAEAKAKHAMSTEEEARRDEKRPAWLAALLTLKAAETAEKPEAVTSRLAGDYSGWTGRTTFRLANGQVWQQVDGTTRVDTRRPAPEVKIYPGVVGTYWLEVEGVRQRVKVKPIRLE